MGRLKIDKRCNWCKAVRADKKLLKRIYESKAFTRDGESIRGIALEVKKGSYESLLNHCKYHQALTDDDLSTKQLEKLAKKTTTDIIRSNVKTHDARQTAIDRMFAKLEMGDFDEKMTVKDLLTAIKHADDVDAKKGDQAIDVMRMMTGIRSGEAKKLQPADGEVVEIFDPWEDGVI